MAAHIAQGSHQDPRRKELTARPAVRDLSECSGDGNKILCLYNPTEDGIDVAREGSDDFCAVSSWGGHAETVLRRAAEMRRRGVVAASTDLRRVRVGMPRMLQKGKGPELARQLAERFPHSPWLIDEGGVGASALDHAVSVLRHAAGGGTAERGFSSGSAPEGNRPGFLAPRTRGDALPSPGGTMPPPERTSMARACRCQRRDRVKSLQRGPERGGRRCGWSQPSNEGLDETPDGRQRDAADEGWGA